MESFLTDLVKPYVEKLINRAITESSYVCCFTCIAKDFEAEKAKLEVERTTFNQLADVATRGGEDVQASALFWKKQADELIQEDTKTIKCFSGFSCNCIWRYRRGKELAKKKEEIKTLTEIRKGLAIGLPAHLPDVERYSSQHYIPFQSRESKWKELWDALNDDNNYIVGLQGMGGTGKTTLVKEVGKKLKQSKKFTQVIDTTVSFSPDIKEIQDDIAGPLGLKFDDCNESDRPKKLWSRLTNGEKILLILDDVWGDINFNEIGIPYSDNRKGCSVLVTTRNQLVCNRLGCSSIIQLDLLSEDDAWIMFQRHAGLSEVSTKDLLKKGRKIATECKRLPIAIAAIASSLKGKKHREDWDVALNSLQKHMSIDGVDNYSADIYKCLMFSYDYLKNKNAEELFLLSSVFQEDEEISTEILTRLGIGVGLFGEPYDKYNNARNVVAVAKNKLLDSCLLLKTNEGKVKMHDLVREVAQWIANKDQIQVVNFSNKNQKSLVGRDNNIKYLLFDGNPMDLCSFRFDGCKLMILIFNMNIGCFEDIPVSFFENIAGLQVLNLKAKWQTMPLPQSIQLLMNLRSLIIEDADLGDLSVLGSLQSLETLDLKYCRIDELPQEIAKLKELRLLNLEQCRIKRNNPFEVIQRCPSLEELYFLNSFNNFCQEIALPTLERYHLTQHGLSLIYDSSLSKCVSLEKDYLSKATFKHVMQTAEHLKLEKVEKGWTNIMPEIVPIDQGMNDLIELHLYDDSQLQRLIDTKHIGSDQVPNVFSKLVVVELIAMNNLEELCNGPISLDSMDSLEELTIMYCRNLRSLFKGNVNFCNLKTVKIRRCSILVSVLSPYGSLPLLEELNISNCDQLENIFTYERRVDDDAIEVDGDNDNNKSCNSLFPKLKVVKIKECPKLHVFVFHLSPSGSLPLLEELNIIDCEQLENIFTYERRVDDVIEEILLPRLKVVKIERCHKLSYIFDQEVKLDSLLELELNDVPLIDIFPRPLSIKGSSNSISKPQVEHIKSNIFSWSPICCYRSKSTKVPSVVSQDQPQPCSISTETSSNCLNIWKRAQCLSRLSHIMCNIKVIKLVDVPEIKSVFMLSITPKMLVESLTVQNCHQLEHIVVDIGDGSGGNELGINVFPKLKELNVVYCWNLEYIFGHINASDDHDQNNNKVQLHLPALKSLKFVKLQSLISLCPKQYHITFPSLKELVLRESSQVDAIKKFSGNKEHFLALKRLEVFESSVESILCLNEESEREINLGLQNMKLRELPMMISLFVGPKNAFALKNLKSIVIYQCEKLEIVFSTSVLRCLSQLSHLTIQECTELKHIIEDDDDIENQRMSNFMPVLETLAVVKCNKLKSIFPISMSKVLPKLEVIIIGEADELEEIFKSVGDHQKVEIPNLKGVLFVNLPSLCQVRGIQFQTVEHCLVHNCKKIAPTTSHFGRDIRYLVYGKDGIDSDVFRNIFDQLEDMVTSSQKESIRTPEAEDEFNENVPDLEIPSVATLATNSKELISEQSTSQQHSLGENDTTIKLSQGDYLEGSMSTISETRNVPPIHVDLKQKGIQVSVEEGTASTSYANTITSSTDHLESELMNEQSMHQQRLRNQEPPLGEIDATMKSSQLEGATSEKTEAATMSTISEPKNEPVVQLYAPKQKDIKISVEEGTSSTHSKSVSSSSGLSTTSMSETSSLIEMKQTPEAMHKLVENVPDLENPSLALLPTNSEDLMDQQSMGEVDTTTKPSQGHDLEGSTLEKTVAAATLSIISETKNEPHIQLDIVPKQKGIEIVVEEGTTSTCDKTITSSTHLEDGDGKISIPSFSTVNTKPPSTKYVDIVDSQEIIAMEDINKLIEEDPLLALVALEKLLTGQVSISSVRVLLQELKTLMDSSSDLDHLVSNQESISKLNSLFHRLNQHQGMLTSDLKDFVEKVQNFFNENIIKHATSQQVLEKHNQLLDSKTDLMNKLWSVKSTQTHIDSETSTTNAQIHELSLQIDELRKKLADLENQRDSLKSVANKCDVQKMKLKAECTELVQQSKIFFSALALSDVSVREAEHARNLAKEGFANLKSSFPRF